MSKKNTQIKKSLCLLLGSLFITATVLSQTTVVDFENPSEYQHLAWNGTPEVVANPNATGINTSATVGKYTIPAGNAWSNASVVIINTPLNLKDLSNLEFSIIAPSGTQMYSKLELDGVGGVAEAYATPTANANWQKITLNFSPLDGVDVNTATYDKFTFFFNVNDNDGGEVWYFDDIIVNNNALSVKENSLTYLNIYPNPVTDNLFVNNTQFIKGTIYNTSGNLIKTFTNNVTNVSSIKPGLYFLSIQNTNGEVSVKKFIKK